MAKKTSLKHSSSPVAQSSDSPVAGTSLEKYLASIPENTQIDHYKRHKHSLELFVSWNEPGRSQRRCPNCGSSHCVKKDGGAMQTVRHVPCGSCGILLTFHKPRFLCRDCGKSFYVRPSWAMPGMSITTYAFIDIVSRLTSSTQCVEQIARDTYTSAAIVRTVMYRIKLNKPESLPVTLGIDEFHGQTGTYDPKSKRFITEKYHCVITDPDNGCVLDILYKATYKTLHDYFMSYPLLIRQKVKFFCADMRGGFSKVARNCFPNAKICVDPFHVVKLITDAVGELRIDAWHSLISRAKELEYQASVAKKKDNDNLAQRKLQDAKKLQADASLVKNSHRVLITSQLNEEAYWTRHEAKRDERLKDLFAIVPELETAYDALQSFYSLADASPCQYQRACLTDWIREYESCELLSIQRAAATIKKRRRGIENSWRFNKSNGPTEGLNKRIKDTRRMAFGAHNFENFRRRALLACGATTIEPAQYTIFDEKHSSPGSEILPRYK